MSLYFLSILLSFLYTANKPYGVVRMMILLPFLVMPFSFYSLRDYAGRWVQGLMLSFILLVAGGNVYSISHYILHKKAMDALYGYSKVIPTPFEQDHIRYSLAVVLSILFGFYLLSTNAFGRGFRWKQFLGFEQAENANPEGVLRVAYSKFNSSKSLIARVSEFTFLHYLLLACTFFSIVYIHILSAKTGLLCFYSMALVACLYYIIRKGRMLLGGLLLLLVSGIPVISYIYFPSFKNKLSYIRYSLYEIQNDHLQTNISDEGRLLSYRYAWRAIQEHPWVGVGVGDVLDAMRIQYEKEIPNPGLSVLLPHNQFLMAWMSGGLLSLIALLFMVYFWIRTMWKKSLFSNLLLLILFLPMLFEPYFETQYGAGLFVFFLLLWDMSERNRFGSKGKVPLPSPL